MRLLALFFLETLRNLWFNLAIPQDLCFGPQNVSLTPSCITLGGIGPIDVICPTLLVDGSLSGCPKFG